MKRSSVEVAIRVRPMRSELNEVKSAWEIHGNTLVERHTPENSFTFDRVYDPSTATNKVYEKSVRDAIVRNVIDGYNGTVFAYGQTGSGKSYTMLGHPPTGTEGVSDMAIAELFSLLEKQRAKDDRLHINITLAMLEIYNEQLRDLFVTDEDAGLPLSIRENEHGVYVHNAVRRPVTSPAQCLHLINFVAEERRTTGATSMNERSSRSHCLIRIFVEKTVTFEADSDEETGNADDDESSMKKKIVSSLNLVDLAGSERVSKTGATGLRMIEGGHINKSLTSLTIVINKLTDKSTTAKTHIPYRDSKLTYLLKTALGGNSFCTVFCCMTVGDQHADESRSTLQFASRAKKIKNEVVMNELCDNKTRLRELELEVKKLRRMLIASDIYLWSKQLKIRNLEERGTRSNAAEVEQMEALIQQLSAENNELQKMAVDQQQNPADSSQMNLQFGFADDEEKRNLRSQCESLRQVLDELKQEKYTLVENLDETERLCDEFAKESDQKDVIVSDQKRRLMEAEMLVQTAEHELASCQGQIAQIQEQRRSEEQRMLERARGDELLEQLTKMHVDQHALELEHTTLLDMYSRTEIEKGAEIEQLKVRLDELGEELESAHNNSVQHQSYLWRLLSAASLLTQQKPLKAAEIGGTVREHQVEAAIKQLNGLIAERAKEAAQFSPQTDYAAAATAEANDAIQAGGRPPPPGATNRPRAVSVSEGQLHKRIALLEHTIQMKDAQRDILIDTKLKRIQDLVVRLHTTNSKLKQELSVVAAENARLHEFIRVDGKLSKAARKEGFRPVDEGEILSRAAYAPMPHPPHGHN